NGALRDCACLAVNGVGKRCAGEPHAPFDRGPLAEQQPRRAGRRAPEGKPEGLSPVAYRSLTSQRPTSQARRATPPTFVAIESLVELRRDTKNRTRLNEPRWIAPLTAMLCRASRTSPPDGPAPPETASRVRPCTR